MLDNGYQTGYQKNFMDNTYQRDYLDKALSVNPTGSPVGKPSADTFRSHPPNASACPPAYLKLLRCLISFEFYLI